TSSATATSTSSAKITHGPLAGAVTDSTAAIWARTNEAARVEIEYSTHSDLRDAARSAGTVTDASNDFTTIAKISHFAPRQTYFYNVRVNDAPQFQPPYPQFQTFGAPGDATPFRFVVLSDFRTVLKISQNVDTFPHAAQEKPAFVIVGGDFDPRNPTTLEEKRGMFRDLYAPANGMEDFVNLILHEFALVHFW